VSFEPPLKEATSYQASAVNSYRSANKRGTTQLLEERRTVRGRGGGKQEIYDSARNRCLTGHTPPSQIKNEKKTFTPDSKNHQANCASCPAGAPGPTPREERTKKKEKYPEKKKGRDSSLMAQARQRKCRSRVLDKREKWSCLWHRDLWARSPRCSEHDHETARQLDLDEEQRVFKKESDLIYKKEKNES